MRNLFLKNPAAAIRAFGKRKHEYWIRRGEVMALDLFRDMAARVPAYKSFLKENKISAQKVRKFQDLKEIPTLSKNNYLRKYPLHELAWDGKINHQAWVISATSGSTGKPFYFLRQSEQDEQYAFTAEAYLLHNFLIDRRSTLYVNCFALGVWIGGLFTYEAITSIARKRNYSLSIISPGINKEEILNAIKNLGDKFDQVILGGYPPFIKDVVDEGMTSGINWHKYRLGFIFSAEGFSESFRNYILRRTGTKDLYRSSLNHYGTVDLGTMAHETPLTILMRQLMLKKTELRSSFFGDTFKLPTLAQFLPEMFFFEEQDGGLLCSARSGLPLVRYDLKDNGGVRTFNEAKHLFAKYGVVLEKEAAQRGLKNSLWHLPFVFVYERKDLSTTLYGLNIYPDSVRNVLQERVFESRITGKCVLLTKTDSRENQYLEIAIELKKKRVMPRGLASLMQQKIVEALRQTNSEYRRLHDEMPARAIPRLTFLAYEDTRYFTPKGKHKWAIPLNN